MSEGKDGRVQVTNCRISRIDVKSYFVIIFFSCVSKTVWMEFTDNLENIARNFIRYKNSVTDLCQRTRSQLVNLEIWKCLQRLLWLSWFLKFLSPASDYYMKNPHFFAHGCKRHWLWHCKIEADYKFSPKCLFLIRSWLTDPTPT